MWLIQRALRFGEPGKAPGGLAPFSPPCRGHFGFLFPLLLSWSGPVAVSVKEHSPGPFIRNPSSFLTCFRARMLKQQGWRETHWVFLKGMPVTHEESRLLPKPSMCVHYCHGEHSNPCYVWVKRSAQGPGSLPHVPTVFGPRSQQVGRDLQRCQ